MILKGNNSTRIIGDGYTSLSNLKIGNNNTNANFTDVNGLFKKGVSEDVSLIDINYNDGVGRIELNNNRIFLSGKNDKTLYELYANLLSLREKSEVHQNLVIEDYPKTLHREFMLDIARNYVSLNEIKKIVDEMFRNRINYLHLHISDDQNYAIESKIHPELNTKEYLTMEEIKELINYCNNKGIEIIPEFDMPGHLNHLLEVNPQLRCNKEKGNSLCFGKNHDYIYEIIDELCLLFPSRYFHIGADELGIKNQYVCPDCKELMRKNGYSSPKELAADFINQIAEYVQSKGKIAIAWNDALRYGHINDDVIIQKWFNYANDKTCLEEVNKGRKIIVSSATDQYLNDIFSFTPLRKTYKYIPEVNGKIIEDPYGVSSHFWTEIISEEDELERMLFPRLQAFGENAWLEYDNLDYKDFLIRMKLELELLKERNISFTNLEDIDKFRLKEIYDFLNKKLAFKNYTDFKTIDLLKMISEYYFDRNYKEVQRKRMK